MVWTMQMADHRLDRIEDKLDKLTELVGSVIRIEEKQAAVSDRLDTQERRLNRQSEKVESIDIRVTRVEGSSKRNSWFVQLIQGSVLTGAIGLMFYFLR